MSFFDPVYQILDRIFYPVFNLLPVNEKVSIMVGIFFVSALIAIITTAVTVKVIDQEEMKINKKKLKDFQKKMNEAREKGDEKKLKKITAEMMEIQGEVMRDSFKPMMYTMAPIILVFSWLRQYELLQTFILKNSYLVSLPFNLPRLPFGWHPGGPVLGWLGWYIVCSFMTSTVVRKIFKIQM